MSKIHLDKMLSYVNSRPDPIRNKIESTKKGKKTLLKPIRIISKVFYFAWIDYFCYAPKSTGGSDKCQLFQPDELKALFTVVIIIRFMSTLCRFAR